MATKQKPFLKPKPYPTKDINKLRNNRFYLTCQVSNYLKKLLHITNKAHVCRHTAKIVYEFFFSTHDCLYNFSHQFSWLIDLLGRGFIPDQQYFNYSETLPAKFAE